MLAEAERPRASLLSSKYIAGTQAALSATRGALLGVPPSHRVSVSSIRQQPGEGEGAQPEVKASLQHAGEPSPAAMPPKHSVLC